LKIDTVRYCDCG